MWYVKNNVKLMELQSELNNLTSIDLSNNSPSMTLYMANNIYPITVGKGKRFDLSKLPAGFDVSKTSNWHNATVNSGVLIVKSVDDFVTYDYDCGNGHKVEFRFRVYSSIKQVSVPWAKYKYLYMNFYTYNGKEQVGVDAGEGYTLSGDIKATQGDTGHAQADMVTDLYSHILDEDCKVNAQKFDESFYQNNDEDNAKRKKDSIDVDKLVASLKDNPDLLDKLLDALK